MLRAMGSQRSGHETDNVEACRDLSGRRIRYVNDEKKCATYLVVCVLHYHLIVNAVLPLLW